MFAPPRRTSFSSLGQNDPLQKMTSPAEQVSPLDPIEHIAGGYGDAKAFKPKGSKFKMKLGRKDKGDKSKVKDEKEKDNKEDPNALNVR
jgi:hypothetical protein